MIAQQREFGKHNLVSLSVGVSEAGLSTSRQIVQISFNLGITFLTL